MMPTLVTGRRLWWGVPALLVLLACLGALVSTAAPNLPQVSVVTEVTLPVVRFVRDVAAAMTVGCLVVGGLLLPRRSPRALRWSTPWAAVWLLALALEVVLTLSEVLSVAVVDVLDPASLWSFLTSVSVGQMFLWQAIAAFVVLLLGQAIISRPTAWVVALIAIAGAAAPAFIGHGGLAGGHVAATISLILHLAAISVWVGGLVVVVALARVDAGGAAVLLRRFSPLALACVVVVAESGLLSASLRLTTPSLLLTTDYGALILVKAALLLWLVLLGWQHRQRVLPQLLAEPPAADSATPPLPLTVLARIAGVEFVAMGLAIAVGVTLARVGPESAVPTAALMNPLAVVVLGAALPLAMACVWRPTDERRWARVARRFPEIAAVVLAVVVVEVAGVGLPSAFLGADFGSLVSIVLLLVTGVLMAIAVQGERAMQARFAAVVAWLVAFAAVAGFEVSRGEPGPNVPLTLLSLAIAAACTLLVRPARSSASAEAAVVVEVSDV